MAFIVGGIFIAAVWLGSAFVGGNQAATGDKTDVHFHNGQQ